LKARAIRLIDIYTASLSIGNRICEQIRARIKIQKNKYYIDIKTQIQISRNILKKKIKILDIENSIFTLID
jgi:hypothetical protein